jgi:hypothetical protein
MRSPKLPNGQYDQGRNSAMEIMALSHASVHKALGGMGAADTARLAARSGVWTSRFGIVAFCLVVLLSSAFGTYGLQVGTCICSMRRIRLWKDH